MRSFTQRSQQAAAKQRYIRNQFRKQRLLRERKERRKVAWLAVREMLGEKPVDEAIERFELALAKRD